MFRIGQKVVCVKSNGESRDRYVKPGDVVTIRSIERCPVANRLALRFEEHTLPICHPLQMEYGFEVSNFRPVVEKKTDISVFEEILRRESIDAPERVS